MLCPPVERGATSSGSRVQPGVIPGCNQEWVQGCNQQAAADSGCNQEWIQRRARVVWGARCSGKLVQGA